MLIEICNDVFDSVNNFGSFRKLLQDIMYERKHDVFINIDELGRNELYNRIDIDDKKIIEDYFVNHIQANNKIDYSISTQNNQSAFNLKEAIAFFDSPVLIILENILNDAYFIDALIKNFSTKNKKIAKHQENRWLQYFNAGGANNIKNTINAIKNNFNNLPKDSHKYLRCIVIMDSDKTYSNMNLKTDKEKTLAFLKENEIKYHILEKREMENYIPDEVIDDIANEENDGFLKGYLNMSPEQKDYFDLEKGFNNKNRNKLPTEIQEYYSTVNDNDYKILRLGNILYKGKMKSDFPKLFKHQKVNRESLLKRVSHQNNKNELQNILSKIKELL